MAYANPNFDAKVERDKKLLAENKQSSYVNDIAQPNPLFKYASVNYLFTLSCLGEKDLTDTRTLLNSVPHDILIRSGGIGSDNNPTDGNLDATNPHFDAKDILNKRGKKTFERAKSVFDNPRDLFFQSVELQSVPSHNQNRPQTSVTSIQMNIVEPQGITFLDRLRAGAANNGYFDHLDAPYLLTIEFAGFDEKGMPPYNDSALKNLKRVIPVKLTDMNLDVNQGGSIYNVTAIPYNEFGFSNTYLYPRTSGSIHGGNLSEACASITEILNNQNLDEKAKALVDKPDIYSVTVDKDFKDQPFEFKNIKSTGMNLQYEDKIVRDARRSGQLGEVNPKQIVKFTSKNSILKILTEICKASPEFGDDAYKAWYSKVSSELTAAQIKGGNQAVYDASNERGMYFRDYQIKTTITPMGGPGNWDQKRNTHRKKINIHITPHYIHAYSLAIPGVSTGDKFKSFVHKKYNYIFTGENVDILNLDINYRLAYFQSRLKDVDADPRSPGVRVVESKPAPRTGEDIVEDGTHIMKSEPGVTKSEGDQTAEKYFYLDQLQDELSNPLADMVNIQMEILGDPAWISQSQFIPLELFAADPKKGGTAERKNVDYWQGGRDFIWNDQYQCYNFDVADPIVMLNFRMPSDVDDKRGVYELADGKSTTFTGLYRIVGVTHNFDGGSFTQTLNMVRFKNQGVKISKPIENAVTYTSDGRSYVALRSEAEGLIEKFRNTAFEIRDVKNIFGKITSFATKVRSTLENKVKNFIKNV